MLSHLIILLCDQNQAELQHKFFWFSTYKFNLNAIRLSLLGVHVFFLLHDFIFVLTSNQPPFYRAQTVLKA